MRVTVLVRVQLFLGPPKGGRRLNLAALNHIWYDDSSATRCVGERNARLCHTWYRVSRISVTKVRHLISHVC